MNGKPAPIDVAGMMNDPVMAMALLVTLIGSHVIGLLFAWVVLRWQVGRHWKRRIALSRRPSLTHAALVLVGFPAMLTLSAAVEQPIMRYVPSMEDLLRQIGVHMDWPGIEALMPLIQQAPWPLALLAVAVLPAINEEFWTRGFLGQGLQARYPAWVAVLIVSFLFGCLHMEPRQGLGAMLLGAVIYGAYLATRSLWVAMGIHFVNNGLAVVHVNDQMFPVLKPLEDGLDRNPALYIAGAAVLFAAVAYALYQTRCKLVPEMEGMPIWKPPGVGGVELPPPGSGTVVTHEPMSALSAALVVVGAIEFGLILALA
jgi:membrane protease YdiL (CAAX protease family)